MSAKTTAMPIPEGNIRTRFDDLNLPDKLALFEQSLENLGFGFRIGYQATNYVKFLVSGLQD